MANEADTNTGASPPNPGNFDELLQSAIAGNADAVTEVVESLRTYLLLIANQELDHDLQAKFGASDLVQSALFAAHQKFAEFQGNSIQALHGWVRKILRNDLVDAQRRYKGAARRRVDVEVPINDNQVPGRFLVDPLETPSTLNCQKERFKLIQDALAELPPNYQRVIELRNWKGKSFVEIGQVVGTGEDAARKLWSRALLRLKEVLHEKSPEFDSMSWKEST